MLVLPTNIWWYFLDILSYFQFHDFTFIVCVMDDHWLHHCIIFDPIKYNIIYDHFYFFLIYSHTNSYPFGWQIGIFQHLSLYHFDCDFHLCFKVLLGIITKKCFLIFSTLFSFQNKNHFLQNKNYPWYKWTDIFVTIVLIFIFSLYLLFHFLSLGLYISVWIFFIPINIYSVLIVLNTILTWHWSPHIMYQKSIYLMLSLHVSYPPILTEQIIPPQ